MFGGGKVNLAHSALEFSASLSGMDLLLLYAPGMSNLIKLQLSCLIHRHYVKAENVARSTTLDKLSPNHIILFII